MKLRSHIIKAKSDTENLFILHYEDMKQNPEIEIKKLNKFLNTNLNEEQIKNVRFGLFDFKVSF